MRSQVFIAITCVAVVLTATVAAATTRHVSPSGIDTAHCTAGPCKTIGYAVGQAVAGDAVSVGPGIYKESILVTKRLSLVGHASVIDATGHANGVVISGAAAAGTILKDFTITNADLEGVLAVQTSRITIANNDVVFNDRLWDPVNIPLPCQKSDDCGEGLHLMSVTDSVVKENLVQHNVGGILLTDEKGPTFGNTIIGNRVLDNEKDCAITLASHYFSLSGPAPANLGGVYRNVVVGNDAERNGAAGVGIFTGPPGAAAYNNLVFGNIARDNGLPGVALHSHAPFQYLNDNVIVFNVLSGNGADDDADTQAPTGISIFSAVIPIPRTTVALNLIAHEHYGVFIVNAVNVLGLRTNQFASSVDVPVSIH